MMSMSKLKRFLFRRGYLPMGDFHDMQERMRARQDEFLRPLESLGSPPVATLLSAEPSAEVTKAYNERRAAAHRRSFELFMVVVKEEGEAQWDRIIDRRAKDVFYSVIVSGLIGYLLGKVL
jgi:hypothetical protein